MSTKVQKVKNNKIKVKIENKLRMAFWKIWKLKNATKNTQKQTYQKMSKSCKEASNEKYKQTTLKIE